eukprot:UN06432
MTVFPSQNSINCLNYQIVRSEKPEIQHVNLDEKKHTFFCSFSCTDAPSDRASYIYFSLSVHIFEGSLVEIF